MQIPQRYQPRLIGLSMGVILALLIWPGTRWLVWSQFALSIPTPASVAPFIEQAEYNPEAWQAAQQRYNETALRHPDDYNLQLADALFLAPADGRLTPDVKVQRLRILVRSFPNRPSLYAAILRFSTQQQVNVKREETYWLSGETPPRHASAAEPPHNLPEQIAAFDQDAAEGERLDPDNAYFSLMRSVGLFTTHRDSEALAALKRAAQKRVWNDYCNDDLESEWELHQKTFGTVGALPRMAVAFGIFLPHYAQIREACRTAIALAARSEQAGRSEEGLEIRDAVRHCGRLMRGQSTNVLGSLVGIAINQISLYRPGGAPAIVNSNITARERRGREFAAWLTRIGHPEELAAVEAETSAGVAVREVVTSAPHNFFDTVPVNLASSWIAAIILLSNALWMLAFGAAACLLARCRPIRTGQGFPPGTRLAPALGIAAGIVAGLRLAVMGMLHSPDTASTIFLAGALLIGILALAFAGPQCPVWLRRGGAFLLSLATTALLCSAFALHISASVQPIVYIMWGMASEGVVPAAPIIQVLCVGLAAVIPLLSLLTFSILSRMWRVPLSVGVVRGLRGCGVPIACILLLAYGILVPFILRQESLLEDGLQRTVQHEGRFMAELAGKTWPGDTH